MSQALKKYFSVSLIFFAVVGMAYFAHPQVASAANPLASAALAVFGGIDGIVGTVLAWIGNMILWVVSRFVWLSGIFLDMSINLSINMSQFLAKLPLIDIGWKIFRDLSNMLFIFILLYIAIKTIIGLGGSDTKSLVTKIIVIALLINFSLFITRIIVDASNILALQFYNSMAPKAQGLIPQDSAFYDGGLSAQFVNALRLTSVYKTGRAGTDSGDSNSVANTGGSVFGSTNLTSDKIIVIAVFGSIFMLIAAFIFFVAGILFIIRMVVLSLLMILSPLAFVGSLLPKTASYASQWWDQLFNQAFFAPAYLALTYVVVKTINSEGWRTALGDNGQSYRDAIVGSNANSVSIIVNFIIIIIFMVASLIVAKKMGAVGTDFAQKWAGKATFGLASKLGRGTFGAVGRAMSTVNFHPGALMSRNVRGSMSIGAVGGGKSWLAKQGNKMAMGSYDVRGTEAGKALSGLIGGTGLGEYKSAKDMEREKRKEDEEKSKDEKAKKMAEIEEQLKTADAATAGTLIAGMTDSEVKGLGGDILTRPEVVAHLNHAHLEAIQKSGHLSAAQKATIKAEILRIGGPTTPGTAHGYMIGGGGNFW